MQNRSLSFIEQVSNVGSGFFLSLLIWMFFIKPVFGIETQFIENLWITFTFTFVSVIRGYLWRRLFNRWGQERAQKGTKSSIKMSQTK